MALLAGLAACGGSDPSAELAERRAMFEAVLSELRREMPDAEIAVQGGADDPAWRASLRERGLLGSARDPGASGWRVEIGMIDAGETPGGEPVVRTIQRLWHPAGRSEQRIAYLLEPAPGDGWRVRDARVEYVADYVADSGAPGPRSP